MQNTYFPATYQPYYQYQQPSYQAQGNYQPQSGITWVDGLSSARAYPIANGNSVLLMDSNENAFYIKSADQSGMPSLRIFDYTERVVTQQTSQPQVAQPPQEQPIPKEVPAEPIDMSIYVTKEELSVAKKDIEDKIDALSLSVNPSSPTTSRGTTKK